MITKVTTIEELKKLWVESFLNSTDKVTKISEGSVLNGIAYGISKIGQKILKDTAIIESRLYPDTATGIQLDKLAELRGIAPRFSSTKSSVYVRLVGVPGTVYQSSSIVFSGYGQNFKLIEDLTIGDSGYAYAYLISQNKGENTNVPALTITKVNPIPAGHQYVINEFKAVGGRNSETDDYFRQRIKDSPNILAKTTLSYLEQVFKKINPNVLRVKNLGLDEVGELILSIYTVNGVDLLQSELDELMNRSDEFFSMQELKPDGLNGYGIKLQNVKYYPIDISFRVDIDGSFDSDSVRKEIQIKMSKIYDYRTWKEGDWIDWIDFLNCVKYTAGVKRVLDNYFYPNVQKEIPRGYLPRIRSFKMMNLEGELIRDLSGNFNPIYFPNKNDYNFQATVLKSI